MTKDFEANGHPNPEKANPWMQELPREASGKIKASEYVVYTVFTVAPEFKGKIAYDMRRRQPILLDKAPAGAAGPWEANHTMHTVIWLQYLGIPVTPNQVDNALLAIAKQNEMDPLSDWLISLEWDHIERIGHWLHTYCQAQDNRANSFMGSRWLIGAVARALQPGCRVDHMLVLEGEQGARKSTLVKVLGGEYAGENLPDFSSRDAMQIAGFHWITEVSEMAAMRRSELEHIKAFLTRTEDTFILKYERFPKTYKRSSVLIGNINPDGNGYLQDVTGNRRFWPVKVGQIDIDALKKDRTQLWAEAVYCFNRGDKWYVENEEQRQLLAEQQSLRETTDGWQAAIEAWCEKQVGPFSATDIAIGALDMRIKDVGRPEITRIGNIMIKLPYSKTRPTIKGKRVWLYERKD